MDRVDTFSARALQNVILQYDEDFKHSVKLIVLDLIPQRFENTSAVSVAPICPSCTDVPQS